ncbi:MAG TPA: carboxypeptidase-like regulatory domain-containing protein [Gemmatimonadaceae bacterium]|jgi:hypothetical protein
MRSFIAACLVTGLYTLIALPAAAQATRSGTVVGTVARDSLGTMVGEAQVQLPELNRSATTNWLGEFDFSNVPPGRYAIRVRAIGFQPLIDSIDVQPGARVDADIILTATPVSLATQHTTATAVEKRLPIGLQEMEDRRKTHLGGYFVTDSTLRANDDEKLTVFLARIPGLHQELGTTGSGTFIANGRESGSGGCVFCVGDKSDGVFPTGKCYVNVFVDGVPFFLGPASPRNPPPDFNALWAHEYSGIEYYPSAATTPSQYNGAKASCGTMLLWTRRTP